MGYAYNLKNSLKDWHFEGNRLLLLTKNALMKRCQKIWAGPSPAPPHLDKIQRNTELSVFFSGERPFFPFKTFSLMKQIKIVDKGFIKSSYDNMI